jgi:hypothetical protein
MLCGQNAELLNLPFVRYSSLKGQKPNNQLINHDTNYDMTFCDAIDSSLNSRMLMFLKGSDHLSVDQCDRANRCKSPNVHALPNITAGLSLHLKKKKGRKIKRENLSSVFPPLA